MAIQDIYNMLTRGAGQIVGGNPAGPIMEGVQGAIDKGRGGLQSVQDMAKLILAQKAQQAANPPDMPFDPEVMRQKLGEAPETFVAPDNKYVVGADPSNVGISAIGIALDMMLKNKAAKSQKLRDEYDKKLARIERIEDKKFEDAYMRAQPEYAEKQRLAKEDREWELKTRGWREEDRAAALKARAERGASMTSGGGRGAVPSMAPGGTGISEADMKWYNNEIDQMGNKVNYDPSGLNEMVGNRMLSDKRFAKIHSAITGGQPIQQKTSVFDKYQLPQQGKPAEVNQAAQQADIQDMQKNISAGVNPMAPVMRSAQNVSPTIWEILKNRVMGY